MRTYIAVWPRTLGLRMSAMPHLVAVALMALGAELPAHAQAVQATVPDAVPALAPLTLQQAVQQALTRHPELAVAQRDVEAASGAAQQAGAWPNPELSTSVEDTRQATRTTAVQISQRLELGGKRDARVQAAQWAQALAQTRLDGRRAELQAQVRAAFRAALTSQHRLALAQRTDELARQTLETASKRVTAGKVSPLEETRARLALSGVALDTAQAEQDLRQARMRLGLLIGLDEARLPPLTGDVAAAVPTVSAQQIALHLPQSPALAEARAEMRRRDAWVEVERSRQVPDVTVGLGTQRNNELGRQQTLLALSLPLPVFDRNQGSIKEAIARADQARDELAATELRLSLDVQAASSRLDNAARQSALIEQQMLPDAQRTYEAATTGFSLGKFNFLDVLDAQRTLFQAQAQHLRALSDAHAAVAELERLLGAPLEALSHTSLLAPQPSPAH